MATKDVRKAIIDRLKTINGETGGYSFNLTGANQVLSGKFERPPGIPPFACVWTAQIDEDFGPRLDEFEQTGTFIVLAFVAPAPKHAGSRQDAAEDMLDDMRKALRADRKLSGNVLRFTTASQAYEDQAAQTPNRAAFGVVMMAITAYWRER